MLFVFGRGKRTHTDHVPTFAITCPNCHNQTHWRYQHHRNWFTLFFIPLIPYESEHYLLCDMCKQGITLENGEREHAKILAGYSKQYLEQQMSKAEYESRVNEARLLH
jgi:hypothetical protein